MSWGRHQVVALATAATIPIVVSGQQPPDAPPEDTTFVFRTGIGGRQFGQLGAVARP